MYMKCVSTRKEILYYAFNSTYLIKFIYLFSARFLGNDKVTADRERLGRSHE